MRRITRDPKTQCWVFTGALVRGYGQLTAMTGEGKSTTVLAHRLAYELYVEPLRHGLQVHHVCENKACCNPEHLQALADLDHKRADRNWVGNRTHCKRGHPLSGDNLSPSLLKQGIRRCKTCAALRQRDLRDADPDVSRRKATEGMRKWRDENREHLREYQRARRQRLRNNDPTT